MYIMVTNVVNRKGKYYDVFTYRYNCNIIINDTIW